MKSYDLVSSIVSRECSRKCRLLLSVPESQSNNLALVHETQCSTICVYVDTIINIGVCMCVYIYMHKPILTMASTCR